MRFVCAEHLISAQVPRMIALDEADLTGADLEDMSLCGRQYTGADLLEQTGLEARAERLGVDLSEIGQPTDTVNLITVDLSGANPRGADLGGAIVMFADLSGADLSCANLSYAHLEGARASASVVRHRRLCHSEVAAASLVSR